MPRRWVYTFQPRFAELVASGAKTQTIRAVRKGPQIEPGDVLSLRAWLGSPRRSKQRLLRPECVCQGSCGVVIAETGVVIPMPFRLPAELEGKNIPDLVAKDDGFRDYDDMLAWFRDTHGLPFTGVLIHW